MNIWMDIAIPALVFAVGCLAVAIGALYERNREKARRLKCEEDCDITDQMIEEHAQRANRVEELLAENSKLKRQLEEMADAYGKLEEKYSMLELGHKLMLAESDGAPKPKETAPKPKRNSRKKTDTQE